MMDFGKRLRRMIGFKVEEEVTKAMKRRMKIVREHQFVDCYSEAVSRLASYLNGHMRFSTDLQETFPELMVLAWHYANREYGCPLKESEYESFVEALRVDVYRALTERTKGFVGMREFYNNKH